MTDSEVEAIKARAETLSAEELKFTLVRIAQSRYAYSDATIADVGAVESHIAAKDAEIERLKTALKNISTGRVQFARSDARAALGETK